MGQKIGVTVRQRILELVILEKPPFSIIKAIQISLLDEGNQGGRFSEW